MNKIMQKLRSLLIILVMTLIFSKFLFHIVLKPKPFLDIEHFQICVINEEKQAEMVFLKRWATAKQPLCTIGVANKDNSMSFAFNKMKATNEWQIFAYGSTADPLVFNYRIEDGKVIPQWQMKGLYCAQFLSGIFGFILAVVCWSSYAKWKKKN